MGPGKPGVALSEWALCSVGEDSPGRVSGSWGRMAGPSGPDSRLKRCERSPVAQARHLAESPSTAAWGWAQRHAVVMRWAEHWQTAILRAFHFLPANSVLAYFGIEFSLGLKCIHFNPTKPAIG